MTSVKIATRPEQVPSDLFRNDEPSLAVRIEQLLNFIAEKTPHVPATAFDAMKSYFEQATDFHAEHRRLEYEVQMLREVVTDI
jgi:hypothetical protein